MGPAGRRFHTHTVLHICVGEGLQNQPSRFEASALPGLQAKDPQISFAGWERAHTYLSRTVRVKLGLLLLSRGGRSVLGVPLLWPRAWGGGRWGEVGGFVRELTATNQTGSPGRQGILTNATAPRLSLPPPQLPRRPDSGMVKGVCAGGRGRVCG